jgi:hypothetical protein
VPCEGKNMNMDKKIYGLVPWKIVINSFMITRYRLLVNKQREKIYYLI